MSMKCSLTTKETRLIHQSILMNHQHVSEQLSKKNLTREEIDELNEVKSSCEQLLFVFS